MNQNSDKPYRAQAGITILMVNIVLFALGVAFLFISDFPPLGLILLITAVPMLKGYFTITPIQGKILFLFGSYQGSISSTGFYWAHPFLVKKGFQKGHQYIKIQDQPFSDLNGLDIHTNMTLTWRIQNPSTVFSQPLLAEEEVEQQTLASTAYIISSLPYFTHTDQNTGKKVGLKGQKDIVERLILSNLQKRLEPKGIQVVEVNILRLSPPSHIAKLQQELALSRQADKNWAIQSPALASHILKQLETLQVTSNMDDRSKQLFLEKVITALNKK